MDEISFILHFVSFSFHLLRIYEDFNCFDVMMYDDVYIYVIITLIIITTIYIIIVKLLCIKIFNSLLKRLRIK